MSTPDDEILVVFCVAVKARTWSNINDVLYLTFTWSTFLNAIASAVNRIHLKQHHTFPHKEREPQWGSRSMHLQTTNAQNTITVEPYLFDQKYNVLDIIYFECFTTKSKHQGVDISNQQTSSPPYSDKSDHATSLASRPTSGQFHLSAAQQGEAAWALLCVLVRNYVRIPVMNWHHVRLRIQSVSNIRIYTCCFSADIADMSLGRWSFSSSLAWCSKVLYTVWRSPANFGSSTEVWSTSYTSFFSSACYSKQ